MGMLAAGMYEHEHRLKFSIRNAWTTPFVEVLTCVCACVLTKMCCHECLPT